jgi:hypothetical protein
LYARKLKVYTTWVRDGWMGFRADDEQVMEKAKEYFREKQLIK